MTPKQLEHLILTNHRSLEMFAAQWTSTPEDCVQEAFLKLFDCDQQIDNPKAWLFRVVRNLAIDSGRSEFSRKNREQRVGKSKPLFAKTDDSSIPTEEVQSALEQLPSDQREIIVTRIWGKLTLEEIGTALGIATSTVHRRYERGIVELKKHFEVNQSKTNE